MAVIVLPRAQAAILSDSKQLQAGPLGPLVILNTVVFVPAPG